MRVVFDTNVLLSATLFGGVPRTAFTAAIEGTIRLVTSRSLLDEYERVLQTKFGFSSSAARGSRNELEAMSELVDPGPVPRTSRDPDDDRFLAVASAAGCDAIVSGDEDLLVLGSYRGIQIVTPRELLELLHEPE